MITSNLTQNIISLEGLMWGIQMLVVILPILYVLFAFIVIRQVRIMTKCFSSPISKVFKMVAKLHFFAALIVAFLSILSLL